MRQQRGYANQGPGLGLDPTTGRDPRTMPRSPSELLEPSRAPGPPRRRQKNAPRRLGRTARILNGLLTLLLVMMLGIGGLFYFVRVVFDRPGPLDHSTVIVIPKGWVSTRSRAASKAKASFPIAASSWRASIGSAPARS